MLSGGAQRAAGIDGWLDEGTHWQQLDNNEGSLMLHGVTHTIEQLCC